MLSEHDEGLNGTLYNLINSKALFSRSSAVDVGLIVTNQFLRIVLFVPIMGGQVAVVLLTICFFIIDDLTRFLLHVLMHKMPFLWYFH